MDLANVEHLASRIDKDLPSCHVLAGPSLTHRVAGITARYSQIELVHMTFNESDDFLA